MAAGSQLPVASAPTPQISDYIPLLILLVVAVILAGTLVGLSWILGPKKPSAHPKKPSVMSGLYFSRPEAKYFGVGKIEKDQVEDYAQRKGMDLPTTERWLSPVLNYNPD